MKHKEKMKTDKTGRRISPRVMAAIPCLNEAQFIGDIVARTRKHVDVVVVIDDGSTDKTSEVAKATGAQVIRHTVRQGAGAATRAAFEAAKKQNVDVLVTLDGDGQHNPDEIPQLLAPILSGEADLVIGSRFLREDSHSAPKYRRFGIDTITWLYNLGSRVKVSDSQCGFRAHSRSLVEAVNITENGFGFSVEVLIQARREKLIIGEIPVSCIYHLQGSSLNPVVHGLGVAWKVIKLRIKAKLLAKGELQRRK